MLGKLNYVLLKHIRENGILYLCFVLLFSIGISFGAFWIRNITTESKNILTIYLNGFFSLIPGNALSNGSILRISLINNAVPAVLLLIFGFTYLGIVFSPLYAAFKGFCFGFTVAFLVEGFGHKGLIFILASLLPHSIVLIPGTIFLCAVSLQYSLYLLKTRSDKRYESRRQGLMNYIISFILGFTALMLAGVIEAYITPIFIRSISSFIL